jgi:hypothetical protein
MPICKLWIIIDKAPSHHQVTSDIVCIVFGECPQAAPGVLVEFRGHDFFRDVGRVNSADRPIDARTAIPIDSTTALTAALTTTARTARTITARTPLTFTTATRTTGTITAGTITAGTPPMLTTATRTTRTILSACAVRAWPRTVWRCLGARATIWARIPTRAR